VRRLARPMVGSWGLQPAPWSFLRKRASVIPRPGWGGGRGSNGVVLGAAAAAGGPCFSKAGQKVGGMQSTSKKNLFSSHSTLAFMHGIVHTRSGKEFCSIRLWLCAALAILDARGQAGTEICV
jgi:hypothetical protein